MEFKAYHKIRQFKDIVRDVQFNANYKGNDADGNPIYKETVKPVLTFTGTTKLHGTNAGVCYTPERGIVAQKRSSLLNPEYLASHFGFNQFVQVEQKAFLTNFMSLLHARYCRPHQQITIYGEWAGTGIQKGVGIAELQKAFYIFDCKVYDPVTEEEIWVNVDEINFHHDKIFNIHDFTTWKVEIDFNQPAMMQNKLVELTEKVEAECPVSSERGIKEGTGEGVVWTGFWNNKKYIFKVKGEKHSVTKVKKLASVDPEVLQNINQFVEYACTPNRIEQGIQETNATEKRHTPDLLRWVANDIISEETDTMVANGLEWKQVAREVSNRTRQYFFAKIDKF